MGDGSLKLFGVIGLLLLLGCCCWPNNVGLLFLCYSWVVVVGLLLLCYRCCWVVGV